MDSIIPAVHQLLSSLAPFVLYTLPKIAVVVFVIVVAYWIFVGVANWLRKK